MKMAVCSSSEFVNSYFVFAMIFLTTWITSISSTVHIFLRSSRVTSLFGNTLEVGFAYETASDRVETKFNSLVHLILEEDRGTPQCTISLLMSSGCGCHLWLFSYVIDHEVNEQLFSSTTLIPIGPDLTNLNKAVGTGTLSSLYHWASFWTGA